MRVECNILEDLFGLSVKQAEKCFFRGITKDGDEYGIAMADGEPELEYMGDVWDFEQQIMAFRSAEGLLFVPRAFAAPCKLTDETAFTLRMFEDDDGNRFPRVAVYHGMICEALLRPIGMVYADAIVKRLARLGAIPTYQVKEDVDKAG